MPIRLWSTVVTQLETRPRFQSTGYTGSALAATRRCPLVDVLLEIAEERVQLRFRPGLPHGRHLALAVAHDRVEARRLRDDRAPRDRGAEVAFALHAVARRAHALELRLSEAGGRADEALIVRVRSRYHPRAHRLVEGAAELCALSDVRPRLVRLEPRVVRLAGNRVGLASELGNPPAVVHVRRADREVHDLADGNVQIADRTGAIRIVELPVVLMAFDRDVEPV